MKYTYLPILLILMCSSLIAQKNIISNSYLMGDTVTLKLDNLGDSIQWQKSFDLINWTEITGQYSDSLFHVVDTSEYIRASVIHGNCNPYFSDTLFIEAEYPLGCPPTVSDVDGNIYNTVVVGIQCWMKENLNTTHYSNGDSIPYITGDSAWISLGSSGKGYCYLNNLPGNAAIYGALYNWAAIINNSSGSSSIPSGVQGICPTGWHIPSDNEWKILEGEVDSVYGYPDPEWENTDWRGYDAGSKLKSTSGWIGGGNGTNSSGFSARPGGVRINNGSFWGTYIYASFASSTESDTCCTWYRGFAHSNNNVLRASFNKLNGLSVRCLKDSVILPATMPIVSTDSIVSITGSSAMAYGELISNGNTGITSLGFCWNITGNPTLTDSVSYLNPVVGAFSANLTDLNYNTSCYVRAFATNSEGTAYGSELSYNLLDGIFSCGDTISDYDGNTYNTVLIGTQCWMKQNLNTSHYANGTPLINGEFAGNINGNYTTKYYFYYNDDPTCTNIYGKLYTWAAVMNEADPSNSVPSGAQGVCPTGWHVPSDEEWKILEGKVDSQFGYPYAVWNWFGYRGNDCGENLKTTNDWFLNGDGTDLYSFSALPGGYRHFDGDFYSKNYRGYWWSSSEASSASALYRSLSYEYDNVSRNDFTKNYGLSVRCIRDSLILQTTLPTVSTDSIVTITNTSATVFGDLISNGSAGTTAQGFCWNNLGNPNFSDSVVFVNPAMGIYSAFLTDLNPYLNYYVRAFATNITGIAYGDELSLAGIFFCGDTVTDYDGNTYNTVLIGTQCWMKENLKTTHYADGTAMIDGTNVGSTSGDYTTKYYFDYNNNPTNSATYGKLYNWAAVMNGSASSNGVPSGIRGICPAGWHVPSDEEWKILEGSVDSQYDYFDAVWNNGGIRGHDVGLNLKASIGWISGGNGPNLYDFSALPGGRRDYYGDFNYVGENGNWWSATEHSATHGWYRTVGYNDDRAVRNYFYKIFGLSVRCLRDTLEMQASIPNLITDTISNVTQSSVVYRGFVINDGGSPVITYGVCWDTLTNPTISDSITINGMGTGSFIDILNGLIPNTTYYVRAYATNSIGTAYGNEVQFTTSVAISPICGNIITDFDGNTYNTVLIGTQCWMKENLKSTHYSDGTSLVDGNNAGNITGNYTTKYYFDYGQNPANTSIYGKLYTWAAVMNGANSSDTVPSGVQGICPIGWHVPSDEEWKILEGTVDTQYDYPNAVWDATGFRGYNAGKNLKTTIDWFGYGGTNWYGFSALPGGRRSYTGTSFSIGSNGYWWSSSEYSTTDTWIRGLYIYDDIANRYYYSKSSGYSVRCLRD